MYLTVFVHFIISSASTWFAVLISNMITDVFRSDASSRPPGDITFNDQITLFVSSTIGIFIIFLMINILTYALLRLLRELEIFKKMKWYIVGSQLFLLVVFLILIYNPIFNYSAF